MAKWWACAPGSVPAVVPHLAALQIAWDSAESRRQLVAVAVPLLATPTYIAASTQTCTRTHTHTHIRIRTRSCSRRLTC